MRLSDIVLAGSINFIKKEGFIYILSQAICGTTFLSKDSKGPVPLGILSFGPYFSINRFLFGTPVAYIYANKNNLLTGAEIDIQLSKNLVFLLLGAIPLIGKTDQAIVFAGIRL
jgi:hypothetical protein